jgi:hypothetical protein
MQIPSPGPTVFSPFPLREGGRGVRFFQQLDDPPHELGLQERYVARRQVRGVGFAAQNREPGREPAERTLAFDLIADDRDVLRQRRHVLTRGGDNDDGIDDHAENAGNSRQHQLVAEGEPGLRPAHSRRPPATENDAADAHRS